MLSTNEVHDQCSLPSVGTFTTHPLFSITREERVCWLSCGVAPEVELIVMCSQFLARELDIWEHPLQNRRPLHRGHPHPHPHPSVFADHPSFPLGPARISSPALTVTDLSPYTLPTGSPTQNPHGHSTTRRLDRGSGMQEGAFVDVDVTGTIKWRHRTLDGVSAACR